MNYFVLQLNFKIDIREEWVAPIIEKIRKHTLDAPAWQIESSESLTDSKMKEKT